MKTLAVIMPTYNAATFLPESIESVLNQTFQDFDFYIIDDCSSDETASVVASYADQRIIYYKNKTNKGIAVTLNETIRKVKDHYSFIARMDADDWCYQERFEKQLAYFKENSKTGVLGTQGYWLNDLNKLTSSNWKYPINHEYIKYYLLFTASFGHSSVIFRSSLFSDVNLYYDESVKTCEDWELWTRMIKVTQVHNLPDFLLKYRINESSNHRNEKHRKTHFEERSKVISAYWHSFGIAVTPIDVQRFYFDTSVKNLKEVKKELLQWIYHFNNIAKQASVELSKEEYSLFTYLLLRRIAQYIKNSNQSTVSIPLLRLVVKHCSFSNLYKIVKTLVK